jgi:hypothetical protein
LSASAKIESDHALVCVDPAHVDQIWPHVHLLLQGAYLGRQRDDTIEAIGNDVKAGHSLLWIVWDGTGILAAATTKVMQMVTRKVLRVECCAGKEVHRWIAVLREIETYGKREGCEVCRIEGREGWKKLLPDYREPYIVLEKVL